MTTTRMLTCSTLTSERKVIVSFRSRFFLAAFLCVLSLLVVAPSPVEAGPLRFVGKVALTPVRVVKRLLCRDCSRGHEARRSCSGDSCR